MGGGYVGRVVVRLLREFGARVVLVDLTMISSGAAGLGVELMPLADMLTTSDIVTLHGPLVPETNGMNGGSKLALLKDGALFVNMGRGQLVDEAALLAELKSGRIEAVLDVYHTEPLPADSRFKALPNARLSSHAAGRTEDSHYRRGRALSGQWNSQARNNEDSSAHRGVKPLRNQPVDEIARSSLIH